MIIMLIAFPAFVFSIFIVRLTIKSRLNAWPITIVLALLYLSLPGVNFLLLFYPLIGFAAGAVLQRRMAFSRAVFVIAGFFFACSAWAIAFKMTLKPAGMTAVFMHHRANLLLSKLSDSLNDLGIGNETITAVIEKLRLQEFVIFKID